MIEDVVKYFDDMMFFCYSRLVSCVNGPPAKHQQA